MPPLRETISYAYILTGTFTPGKANYLELDPRFIWNELSVPITAPCTCRVPSAVLFLPCGRVGWAQLAETANSVERALF